jgi:hypothetical protein
MIMQASSVTLRHTVPLGRPYQSSWTVWLSFFSTVAVWITCSPIETPFQYKPMKLLVKVANGKTVPIVGSGYVQIKNSLGEIHTFKDVHVPSLSHPLISFVRLFLKNCSLV